MLVFVFVDKHPKADAVRPFLAPCFSILFVLSLLSSIPQLIQYADGWRIFVNICQIAVQILLCAAAFKHSIRLKIVGVILCGLVFIGQSLLWLNVGLTPFVLGFVQNIILSLAVANAYLLMRKKAFLDMVDALRAVKAEFTQNQISEQEYNNRVQDILSVL